jgi:hypothetical protein
MRMIMTHRLSIITRARPFIALGGATVLLLNGCAGKDGGGPTAPTPTPPSVSNPEGSPVLALDDAVNRIAPELGACSAAVTTELNSLRGKMSPFVTATRADLARARSTLATCTGASIEADRDAAGFALDVVGDVLTAVGR